MSAGFSLGCAAPAGLATAGLTLAGSALDGAAGRGTVPDGLAPLGAGNPSARGAALALAPAGMARGAPAGPLAGGLPEPALAPLLPLGREESERLSGAGLKSAGLLPLLRAIGTSRP